MDITRKSDDKILELNERIQEAIELYVPKNLNLTIRFDLPEQGKVNDPTVSVFLYDIQEDLQLRNSESRLYDPSTGKAAPGCVQVRCCYLITYWEKSQNSDSPAVLGARSDAMVRMNWVLNALVNHRTLPGLSAYCRVLPPAEHLTSLGAFWQALDNKPRLSLSYMVTVPITLTDLSEPSPSVREPISDVQPKPAIDLYRQAEHLLRDKLSNAVDGMNGDAIELEKVRIRCNPIPGQNMIDVKLSGVVSKDISEKITQIVNAWRGTTISLAEGVSLTIESVDDTALNCA
ncbi:DUF4255 domain-containing protein [Mycetohabitans endofungorum]|uniref:DUF4255 domain-containing protein n=1 Tax=Mycetohabitans endofungorum TaxID=417203 RepID=UPI002B0627C1|nr:DUF4255 domain-containing protein [Mycetohabitans endofungorum]